MNAPVKITPARDRYIPIVTHHVPGCEGRALMLRCSILLMRDKAASSMRHCSDEAYDTLAQVQRLASAFSFKAMPSEDLAELRHQIVKLTLCASGLEAFAFNLGGTDAGG